MAKQNNDRLEYYKVAIELITYEGQRLWQVFHLYLITQILLIGALLSTKKLDLDISIAIGFAGLLLCIPWAGAYFRHSQWYIYRLNDAEEIENDFKFISKKREFGVFDDIFRPMHTTGLIIVGISYFYLFFLYKLGIHCFYLSVLSVVPLSILFYHFYLVWKWKKNKNEKE